MTDRRTLKTQQAIKDALLQLLTQKELSKISIAELTRLADIGRGTFYLHYQDIYDLYEQMEDELVKRMVAIVHEEAIKINFSNYGKMLTLLFDEMLAEQGKIKLFMAENDDLFSKVKVSLLHLLTQDYAQFYKTSFDLTETKFMLAGTLGILEDALKNDEDLTELTDDLGKILAMFEEE